MRHLHSLVGALIHHCDQVHHRLRQLGFQLAVFLAMHQRCSKFQIRLTVGDELPGLFVVQPLGSGKCHLLKAVHLLGDVLKPHQHRHFFGTATDI